MDRHQSINQLIDQSTSQLINPIRFESNNHIKTETIRHLIYNILLSIQIYYCHKLFLVTFIYIYLSMNICFFLNKKPDNRIIGFNWLIDRYRHRHNNNSNNKLYLIDRHIIFKSHKYTYLIIICIRN